MTIEEAEQVRQMIDGHWNLRMNEATSDLWIGALLPQDPDLAVKSVGWLARHGEHPPRIRDLEEVIALLAPMPEIPPAGSACPTCHGNRFVLVQRVSPLRSQWLTDRDAHQSDDPVVDQYAPCPDCNSEADTSFRRGSDGTMVETMDPSRVREMMLR